MGTREACKAPRSRKEGCAWDAAVPDARGDSQPYMLVATPSLAMLQRAKYPQMRSGPGSARNPPGLQVGQLCHEGLQAVNLQLQALGLVIVFRCHRARFGAFQLGKPRGGLGIRAAGPGGGCCCTPARVPQLCHAPRPFVHLRDLPGWDRLMYPVCKPEGFCWSLSAVGLVYDAGDKRPSI